jgi:xanthine phosphoribosyltransferase
MGLVRLVQPAGAPLVGIGVLIEKEFEGGRNALAYLKVPVHTLLTITSMDNGKIIFSDRED